MPRTFELYLRDIATAISHIEQFTAGFTEERFTQDELHLHSTLYNLMVIGEAVKSLPEETQAKVPSVAWQDIERFRDKLVHHYYSINPHIVWQIIQEDLPPLKQAVEKLLQDTKDTNDGDQ